MAKKKSKSKRNDSRGYATTSSKSTQTVQKVAINTKTHAEINSLLSEISQDRAKSSHKTITNTTSGKHEVLAPAQDITSHRFLQKVTKIHGDLSKYGFTEDQIKLVVQKLAGESNTVLTFDLAIDWLCVNLPEEELPSLFTENADAIRDKVVGRSASIKVIKADPKLATEIREQSNTLSEHKVFEDSKAKLLSRNENEETEKSEIAQRAWLLEQYAYEQDETEVDCEGVAVPPQSSILEESTSLELSPEEVRLAKLESQLKQLNHDLNDEASNYMRSKHEIIELKKQRKQLSATVNKLKSKVQKQKREKILKDDVSIANENKDQLNNQKEIAKESEADGDVEMNLFSMFDEDANDVTTSSHSKQIDLTNSLVQPKSSHPDQGSNISSFSIPQNWTGKTPQQILEEYCRKHGFSKPKFQKMPRNGYQIIIFGLKKKKDPIVIESNQAFESLKNAQNYLATEALFQLNPALPLYRLFPPAFRDLWKSWLDEVTQTKHEKDEQERNAELKKMKDIVRSISVSRNMNQTKLQTTETNDDSWDQLNHEDLKRHHMNRKQKPKKNQKEGFFSGQKMLDDYNENFKSKTYQKMFNQRKTLPMYSYRDNLLSSVDENPVTVLCGETGCGKTTQCPQYLLEQYVQNGQGDKVNIICTQPRRVAAMSVAERVAEEFGMGTGKAGDYVGYHIRMEAKKSEKTRLLFCTTGVILRRLQDDPQLIGVTHVVVDEVHERQWQIDFLLIALRKLVSTTRKDLKILLMSATLDSKLFCNFFNGAPFLSVPGRTFPVSTFFLEDLIDATDHVIEEYSPYAKKKREDSLDFTSLLVSGRGGTRRKELVSYDSEHVSTDVSEDYVGYKMTTRRSMDRVDEEVINYDLIEDLLALILLEDQNIIVPPKDSHENYSVFGATLIFLPGLGEIRTLSERLEGSRLFGKSNKFEIIPLHSTLSPKDQRRAFLSSKHGSRKIILSTNIAETSVTIPDVTCVIDVGLVREVRQNKRTSTSTLVTDWCSKASAKQRAGRAGRVQPGICCKLYSSWTAQRKMKDQAMPELQRVPLEEVCLSILAGGLGLNCKEFLSQAPQPPSEESVSKALHLLEEVGAVETQIEKSNDDAILTPLGYHLAKLPVHVKLGKMLIFGCIFNCLDKVLTIAATLSSKSPFSNYLSDDASHASAAHRTFFHETSDFFTLCNAWDAYRKAKLEGNMQCRRFCSKMYLSRAAFMEIDDTRKKFLELLTEIGFIQKQRNTITHNSDSLLEGSYNTNGGNLKLVNAVICAGLYPNIVHAMKETSGIPSLWYKKERVHFHSSSVNHKKKDLGSEWIMFHEKFALTRVLISSTSVTQPFSLLLFGSKIEVKHTERKIIVDDWIELSAAAKTGVMFRELRRELEALLRSTMSSTHLSARGRFKKIIDGIVQLITYE